MNCSVVHQKLTDYVEKRLTDLEMNEIEHHLIQCEQARKLHYELIMLHQNIEQDKIMTVSNDFDDRVLSQLAAISIAQHTNTTMIYRLSVAAAVAASVVLGIRIGTSYTATQQSQLQASQQQEIQLLADAEQEQYEAVLYGN